MDFDEEAERKQYLFKKLVDIREAATNGDYEKKKRQSAMEEQGDQTARTKDDTGRTNLTDKAALEAQHMIEGDLLNH